MPALSPPPQPVDVAPIALAPHRARWDATRALGRSPAHGAAAHAAAGMPVWRLGRLTLATERDGPRDRDAFAALAASTPLVAAFSRDPRLAALRRLRGTPSSAA